MGILGRGCGRLAGWMLLISCAIGPEAGAAVERRESWDAIFVAGKKVGYIETVVEPVKAKDGRDLLRVEVVSQLRFKRLEDTVTLQSRFGTIETQDGSVLKMDLRTLAGPTETRVSGQVEAGKMNLSVEGGGQSQAATLDWGDDIRGPYGPEQSMSRNPMKENETRVVKTFLPDLNVIGTTTLQAQKNEAVELGGGAKFDLLRVQSKVTGADGKSVPGMDATYWVDANGQILKSFTDFFGGMTTFRTTKEAALAAIRSPLDLLKASIVPIGQKINRPEATRYSLFKVILQESDAAEVFSSDARQSVRKDGNGEYLLEVRTLGPTDGQALTEAVAPEYLQPSAYINSEDPRVEALSRQAVGNLQDPWQKAAAISTWVWKNMKTKNFSVAFANAKDTARDLTGDCTEHSVLTAAMCRAAGIPTRVVIGLVYAAHLGGFGYHAWNEVHVNGRWVALDPTFGQTDVDALHLKLSESSLAGVSPYAEFLDVAKVFNKLKLEPVDIR